MNDGTNLFGTWVNPGPFSIEDMIRGNPLVGNKSSIINVLNREQREHESDYSIYDDTFVNPDQTSLETNDPNNFPVYFRKPFTSRERCQCED